MEVSVRWVGASNVADTMKMAGWMRGYGGRAEEDTELVVVGWGWADRQ